MSYPLQLEQITIQGKTFELYVPISSAVQTRYSAGGIDFPYWSKVWPSAIAICDFLMRHREIVSGKDVIEIGAGLGLPSLVAAMYARSVHCTDYLPEPVEMVQASAAHLGLANLTASVQDWTAFTNGEKAQVVLASDVNYAPGSFGILHALFTSFIAAGTTIVLSTPHRIAGKTFIGPLLPHCTCSEVINIDTPGGTEPVSVLVLASV
jgi:predicted nicotinamide N-methyase